MEGVRRLWRAGHFAQNVLILGAGPVGRQLVATMRAKDDGGARIVGVFDDDPAYHRTEIMGVPVLGDLGALLAYAQSHPIDQVILAMDLGDTAAIDAARRRLMVLPVHLALSMDQVSAQFRLVRFGTEAGVPLAYLANKPLEHWSALAKRLEDLIVVGILSILALPVFLVIALLIKLDSPGPVFFTQKRFGLNNRVITVLKFRTMHHDRSDHSGAARTVRDDPRVTRIGRYLRKYSLDELPQFINVLRGDMSLIGPRAHAVAMKANGLLYGEAVADYSWRHRVRPGMTGWAQVNGLRGEVDTLEKAEQRVEYDLYYIDNWSLWFDLRIILLSFRVVLGEANAF
jgi:Undecaprenyl-phosphate glucose phosphotransferase